MSGDGPTYGSLFSGIDGLGLGLERAGWRPRWQVEYDAECQRVLERRWPDVQRYGDVTAVEFRDLEPVDLICGGFPCQPVSVAGRGLAQADPRWLWPHFARAVRDLRPALVLVENVPGLALAGLGDVLGDLAQLGYDAEWDRIGAVDALRTSGTASGSEDFDAGPHKAPFPTPSAASYGSSGNGSGPNTLSRLRPSLETMARTGRWPTPHGFGLDGGDDLATAVARRAWPTPMASDAKWRSTPASSARRIAEGRHAPSLNDVVMVGAPEERTGESGPLNPEWVEWLMGFPLGWTDLEVDEPLVLEGEPWPAEPEIPRMRRDVPRRAARLKQLGNAVVPKNAELVGWRLRQLLEEVEPE